MAEDGEGRALAKGEPGRANQGPDPGAGAPAGLRPPGATAIACTCSWSSLVETLAACGVCGHHPDLFLEHDVLRRGRTDDVREPPEMGGVPIGPAAWSG